MSDIEEANARINELSGAGYDDDLHVFAIALKHLRTRREAQDERIKELAERVNANLIRIGQTEGFMRVFASRITALEQRQKCVKHDPFCFCYECKPIEQRTWQAPEPRECQHKNDAGVQCGRYHGHRGECVFEPATGQAPRDNCTYCGKPGVTAKTCTCPESWQEREPLPHAEDAEQAQRPASDGQPTEASHVWCPWCGRCDTTEAWLEHSASEGGYICPRCDYGWYITPGRTRDDRPVKGKPAQDAPEATAEQAEQTVTPTDELLSRVLRAFCLTRDYVYPRVFLPAISGWTWYDVCKEISAMIPDDQWAIQFKIRCETEAGQAPDSDRRSKAQYDPHTGRWTVTPSDSGQEDDVESLAAIEADANADMGAWTGDGLADMARAVHYPECWDTVTYPTLAHALWEMIDGPKCTSPECVHKDGQQDPTTATGAGKGGEHE